jgi:hypothetical protein
VDPVNVEVLAVVASIVSYTFGMSVGFALGYHRSEKPTGFYPDPDPTPFDAYLTWLQEQKCIGCGTAYKERKPDEMWATEFECMACFDKRCKEKRDAGQT